MVQTFIESLLAVQRFEGYAGAGAATEHIVHIAWNKIE